MEPEAVADLVAGVWPSAQIVGRPEPLPGGFSSVILRFDLANQPAEVPSAVVLRLVPNAAIGTKEFAVQQVVADSGYPAPRIHARGTVADGEWALMDFVEGSPALGGLDGLALLRSVPRLLGWMPAMIATAMAQLHRIDLAPVTAAVRSAAPSAPWTLDELLAWLDADARAAGRTDLAAAVRRLTDRRPSTSADSVVCHGDFHPLNIITGDRSEAVIDWTDSLAAEPAYDVAWTRFLLANPPVRVRPAPADAAVRSLGRIVARRFIRHYTRANPAADLSNLEWCRAVHGARILIELARLGAEVPPDHPFLALVSPAGTALKAATGIAVA